jgi:hypothetical protein
MLTAPCANRRPSEWLRPLKEVLAQTLLSVSLGSNPAATSHPKPTAGRASRQGHHPKQSWPADVKFAPFRNPLARPNSHCGWAGASRRLRPQVPTPTLPRSLRTNRGYPAICLRSADNCHSQPCHSI